MQYHLVADTAFFGLNINPVNYNPVNYNPVNYNPKPIEITRKKRFHGTLAIQPPYLRSCYRSVSCVMKQPISVHTLLEIRVLQGFFTNTYNKRREGFRVGFVICIGEEPLKNPYF
jgi:hypothetical protein